MYAADYGVPQKRERVIICGIRNDLKKGYEFPEPVLKESEYIPLKYFSEKFARIRALRHKLTGITLRRVGVAEKM